MLVCFSKVASTLPKAFPQTLKDTLPHGDADAERWGRGSSWGPEYPEWFDWGFGAHLLNICYTITYYNSLENLVFQFQLFTSGCILFVSFLLVTIFLRSFGCNTIDVMEPMCTVSLLLNPQNSEPCRNCRPDDSRYFSWCDGMELFWPVLLSLCLDSKSIAIPCLQTSTLTTFIYSSTIPRLQPTNLLKLRCQALAL